MTRGETKFVLKKDLMYRQFTKGNKLSLQLVIPESFREKVLRLAHETLMSGHLSIKKTMDRVLTEFSARYSLFVLMCRKTHITHSF